MHFSSVYNAETYISWPKLTNLLTLFEVDYGMSVELNIVEYDLEGAADCHYDYLEVYGGPDTTSPRLTQLCSRRSDNVTVSSNGNRMLVRFRSDGSIRGKGFLATYKTRTQGK